MDSAWIGVIGSLGGVLLTSGVGVGGAALNHRWQDDARGKDREDRLQETRAALRRDAYTRFLVAGDQMADFLLTQPPPDSWNQEDLIDPAEAGVERLRMLWSQGDSQVAEYGVALMQARLLAGLDVVAAIEEYNDWMFEQVFIIVEAGPLSSRAFNGRSEKCKQLVQVMRREQEGDLLNSPRSD